MSDQTSFKKEKLALTQLIGGMDKIFSEITTRAMNNINSVMAPIVDEARMADEHAILMMEWKEDLRIKLDQLVDKARIRISAIEEYEHKSATYSEVV